MSPFRQHLVQIDRIDGPTEKTLTAIKSQGEVIEGGVTMPGDASLSRPSTGQRPGSSSGVACKNLDKYSGSTENTTHLNHISHRKTASGINWSNRWTYRVFIINTRRD